MRQYYYGLLIFLSVLMAAYLKNEQWPLEESINYDEKDPSINLFFPVLFPPKKLDKIARDHRMNDKDFQMAVIYLFSTKWQDTVEKLMKTEEYAKFRDLLAQQKVNVDGLIHSIKSYNKQIFTDREISRKIEYAEGDSEKGSFKSFIDDLFMEYKIDKIAEIIIDGHHFLDCTREFAEINKDIVKQVGENNVIDNMLRLKEAKKIIKIFKDVDINIKHYIDMFYPLLIGLKLPDK